MTDDDGTDYIVRSYGKEREDGTWIGWIEFHPTDGISPVLQTEQDNGLVMVDHQSPGPLGNALGWPQTPSRDHIHTVVRTPNGNDYGKDLLRQHLLTTAH